MITYSYKNLTPYGAADIYCMDQYLPDMKFPTSYAQFIVKKDGE